MFGECHQLVALTYQVHAERACYLELDITNPTSSNTVGVL